MQKVLLDTRQNINSDLVCYTIPLQATEDTPAFLGACEQLISPFCMQSSRRDSVPLHCTPSSSMGVDPTPKYDPLRLLIFTEEVSITVVRQDYYT